MRVVRLLFSLRALVFQNSETPLVLVQAETKVRYLFLERSASLHSVMILAEQKLDHELLVVPGLVTSRDQRKTSLSDPCLERRRLKPGLRQSGYRAS
ncbi:hypothetical protein ASG19_14010 [Rhizobium sp. Leaf306]|uniref:hypothetical protein n=1 Tax=Rhizobium sp. Leaf306 TaxID=1736330 RepID=UPI000714FEC6|nr:hypothetical protein [Rhizobium sp. Leaf306]KQQ34877.1 hypothetical protein ASG19_14010 [Rhizobium sp. Leaf306]